MSPVTRRPLGAWSRSGARGARSASVERDVDKAETRAIDHNNQLIEATDQLDWVTRDLTIGILPDEECHRRLFEGHLREFEAGELT